MNQDKIKTKDHAFIIYEFKKCKEDQRNTEKIPGCVENEDEYGCVVDPPCATNVEIGEWLRNKRIMFKVIDNHPNFKHDQAGNHIKSERRLQTIPMGDKKYTDSGYRYRKNIIEASNSWYTTDDVRYEFFNVHFYN